MFVLPSLGMFHAGILEAGPAGCCLARRGNEEGPTVLARGGRAFPEGRGMWLVSEGVLDLQEHHAQYSHPWYILFLIRLVIGLLICCRPVSNWCMQVNKYLMGNMVCAATHSLTEDVVWLLAQI